MQSLRKVGMDTGSLTDEELLLVDSKIVEAVRPQLVGRRLMTINKVPHAGFLTVRGHRATDMSGASMSLFGDDGSLDKVSLTPFDIPLPVIKKPFKLFWRDLLASRGGGLPLDTINIENAARQVAEEEDAAILTGETTLHKRLGLEGLATATGRNEQNGGDWSSTCITEISTAIGTLAGSGYQGPYASVMPSTFWGQLLALISNTAVTYLEVLQKMLTGGIFISDNLTAADDGQDSILVLDTTPGNFELVVGQDMTTYQLQDKDMNYDGMVYEVAAPKINRPSAIVEINTLT
jgi:uncharacterized linocin/CFP29 family protein